LSFEFCYFWFIQVRLINFCYKKGVVFVYLLNPKVGFSKKAIQPDLFTNFNMTWITRRLQIYTDKDKNPCKSVSSLFNWCKWWIIQSKYYFPKDTIYPG